MRRAFTIVELLVAMGLFGMLLAASGVIFATAVNAHRTAEATSEITQNLAAITDQLNADFRGLRKDMPAAVAFDVDDPCSPGVRLDRIIFFANGDFQSVRQYGGQTVVGNVASIFYGQSDSPDPNSLEPDIQRKKILARKQVIFTSLDPDPCNSTPYDEYVVGSLSQWLTNPPTWKEWIRRPDVDINVEEHIPMFMAQGVDDFTIQVDFGINPDGSLNWQPQDNTVNDNKIYLLALLGPQAIKFTFTLYDSKGIFPDGKTFTHIVYLDN
jgi:prepilin-type N-terminal cleavage/methylation domain-containing protein